MLAYDVRKANGSFHSWQRLLQLWGSCREPGLFWLPHFHAYNPQIFWNASSCVFQQPQGLQACIATARRRSAPGSLRIIRSALPLAVLFPLYAALASLYTDLCVWKPSLTKDWFSTTRIFRHWKLYLGHLHTNPLHYGVKWTKLIGLSPK